MTREVLSKLLSDHVGRNNAITQSQLATALDMNPSTLRSELRRLREERNIPIGNLRDGYYIISSKEELREFIGHKNGEIQSKKRTIEHTLEAFEEFDGEVEPNPEPEIIEQSYPCADCGADVLRSDVMYWESDPLCRTHWAERSGSEGDA